MNLGVAGPVEICLTDGRHVKAPGSGVLEFELQPLDNGDTQVTATAYWHPRGVWGLVYWYALLPVLHLVFGGFTAAIARRAEEQVATVGIPE